LFVFVPFIPSFTEALGNVGILNGFGIRIGWTGLALSLTLLVLIFINPARLTFPGERVVAVEPKGTIMTLIHNAGATQGTVTIIEARAPEHRLIHCIQDNACVVSCGVVSVIEDANITNNVVSDKILARLAELTVFVAIPYLERKVSRPVVALRTMLTPRRSIKCVVCRKAETICNPIHWIVVGHHQGILTRKRGTGKTVFIRYSRGFLVSMVMDSVVQVIDHLICDIFSAQTTGMLSRT
tara:strand:- start:1088 stop:1807 length:720 start_codon:yes stop_codon:yes gene_type:complete